LFLDLQIDEVDSANQKKSEMMKLQWCIEGGGGAAAESSDKNTPHVDPMIKKHSSKRPNDQKWFYGDPRISTKHRVVLASIEIKNIID
jgi:hypothetical protein